jgi:triosephosphate isomerase
MNLNSEQSLALFNDISVALSSKKEIDFIVFPPFLYLKELIDSRSFVEVGAQNFHPELSGAFTGEVSVSQLNDIGVKSALVGHSERRISFKESNSFLKQKVDAAIQHQIRVVFCCGEPLEVRENQDPVMYVTNQLEESLFHLNSEQLKTCMIAYEPIWAIGTGKVATEEQISQMHTAIRNELKSKYGQEIANEISILYGGSCKPSNAKAIFSCENVDGGLIGGASLDSTSFIELSKCF